MITTDAELDQLRSGVFAVAYRMLGRVADAEDIAQESLLRYHLAIQRGDRISSPRAYVATIATRLSINELRSARARREQYVGPWLPEPLITDPSDQPAGQLDLIESLSMAILTVLERLTPEQRAAFLLREVFAFDYVMIAKVLGRRPEAVRQLVTRARKQVRLPRSRFRPTAQQHDALADRFLRAARDGDLDGLVDLLSGDVELTTDSDGQVPALSRPVRGHVPVARATSSWLRRVLGLSSVRVERHRINGEPGAILLDDDRPIGVYVLSITGTVITQIRSVVNPDKLRGLGPPGDLTAVFTKTASRARSTTIEQTRLPR